VAVPTITNNSPQLGDIAWGPFTIQYNGVGYAIGAGSTSQRWVWWRYAINTIEAGPDLPTDLTDDDLVLFGNKNGIGVRIQSSTLVDGELVVDGSILARAVSAEILVANEIFSREGYFGTVQAEKIQSGSLSAALGLLGSLAVGDITISPQKGVFGQPGYDPGGIVIPLTSGGVIQLPADGGTALIEAILKTKDLTVDGGLTINGLTNAINGVLLLGSGTPNPSSLTGIGVAQFMKTTKLNSSSYASWSRGLAVTTSGHYATIVPLSPDSSRKELRIFDPTTKNVVATVNSDDAVLDMLGVTAVGNTFYVIGQRWNASTSRSEWRVHGYTTTGANATGTTRWIENELGERLVSSTYYGMAIAGDPDGTHFHVARVQANGSIHFMRYTTTSVQPNDWWSSPSSTDCTFLSGAYYVGQADLGLTGIDRRHILGGVFDAVYHQEAFNPNTGVVDTANSFGTAYVDGLIYDGTRFVTLDSDSSGFWLSHLNTTKVDTTVYAQHEWAASSGKRSAPSTVASKSIPRRLWPLLTIPAPPRTGTGVDVADRVNVYLDTDNVTKLVQQLVQPATATTLVLSAMAGTGVGPNPGATEFVAADSSGILESIGTDPGSGTRLVSMDGSGSWRLGELKSVGATKRFEFPAGVNVPPASPFSGPGCDFYRIGNFVIADISVTRVSSFTSSYTSFTGVSAPAEFRPIGAAASSAGFIFYTSAGKYQFRIGTGGAMEVRQSAADTTPMSCTLIYKVAS
jgi:hypothetical protein